MKTTSLPIKALLAVIAAVALIPVAPAAAALAFTSTGLIAMLASDYGRTLEPVRAQAGIVPFELGGRGAARLNEAA
jgi:hypothetical protein